MRKVILLLFFSIGILFFNRCTNENSLQQFPIAKNGKLDLTHWDFFKQEPIALEGEWEFYWEKFLLSNSDSPQERSLLYVPSQWQQKGFPTFGYATFRLSIRLPESVVQGKEPLSLEIPDMGTAYELYANGKQIAQNGKIGISPETSNPFLRYQLIPLDFVLENMKSRNSQDLEILVWISNFHYSSAGFWNPCILGLHSQLEQKTKSSFVLNLIVFSALFFMGFYHIGIYFNRTKDISPLYFGLFCLLIAIRTLCTNERMIFDIFPSISFFLVHRFEFFSFYCGVLVFVEFLNSLFPEERSRYFSLLFYFTLIPASISTLILSMNLYTMLLPFIQFLAALSIVYVAWISFAALLHKKRGSLLFLIGYLLYASFVAHDLLIATGVINGIFLGSYGLLLFTIFQAILLSRRFAHAFSVVEELTESLEKRVLERTHKLEHAYRELEILAESRMRLSKVGEMVSGIIHDIKNPMTTIKAFTDLAEDSSIGSEKRKEYFNYIRREIDRLSDMTFELLDFSKGKMLLNIDNYNVCDFIQEIQSFLIIDFQYAEIEFTVDCQFKGNLDFDRERLRRVLVNLANNAREAMMESKQDNKFGISVFDKSDRIEFIVSDNGPGISESLKGKLFEAFATEGKLKGTGLGLYMSRWIIDQHGGNIFFHSEKDKGTSFFIHIPKENKKIYNEENTHS